MTRAKRYTAIVIQRRTCYTPSMSKLIAFRMPDVLLPLFEAKCTELGLGASAGMVAAVKGWVSNGDAGIAMSPPAPLGPRPKTAVLGIVPKRKHTVKVGVNSIGLQAGDTIVAVGSTRRIMGRDPKSNAPVMIRREQLVRFEGDEAIWETVP